MSAVIRSTTHTEPHPYVHKLRLEAREGAAVDIKPTAPLAEAGTRILAKLVGAALAAAALLMMIGDHVVS